MGKEGVWNSGSRQGCASVCGCCGSISSEPPSLPLPTPPPPPHPMARCGPGAQQRGGAVSERAQKGFLSFPR